MYVFCQFHISVSVISMVHFLLFILNSQLSLHLQSCAFWDFSLLQVASGSFTHMKVEPTSWGHKLALSSWLILNVSNSIVDAISLSEKGATNNERGGGGAQWFEIPPSHSLFAMVVIVLKLTRWRAKEWEGGVSPAPTCQPLSNQAAITPGAVLSEAAHAPVSFFSY